jgi:hypothetical protein
MSCPDCKPQSEIIKEVEKEIKKPAPPKNWLDTFPRKTYEEMD